MAETQVQNPIPVKPTTEQPKTPTLADATAKLDALTKFYSDDKFKKPGFNPFFMLKRLADLKAELVIPAKQAKVIEAIMAIKQTEPTLASLKLEEELYRPVV